MRRPLLTISRGAPFDAAGEMAEVRIEARIRFRTERRQVATLQRGRAHAVVARPVEVKDRHAFLEHRDEGQEQRPVQAAAVKIVGRDVRGRDNGDAVEELLKQPAEDHRIGDVVDHELIEAEERQIARDLRRHRRDRIAAPLPAALLPGAEGMHTVMHLAHERVEMDAPLCIRRRRLEEKVHQHGLAAPYRTPNVEAARRCGSALEETADDSVLPRIGTGLKFQSQRVENVDEVALNLVRLKPARFRSWPRRGGAWIAASQAGACEVSRWASDAGPPRRAVRPCSDTQFVFRRQRETLIGPPPSVCPLNCVSEAG